MTTLRIFSLCRTPRPASLAPIARFAAGFALMLCGIAGASAAPSGRPPTLDPTYGRPIPRLPKAAKTKTDAAWIWTERTANDQTIFLRGTALLSRKPKHAVCYVTADDFFTLYINGRLVDQSKPDPNDGLVWKHVHRPDVTRYLIAGRNVIALRAQNAGGPAGALVRLEVDGKAGLLSGSDWKATEGGAPPANWDGADFNDASWMPAHVVGPLTADPWFGAGGIDGWPGYESNAPYLAHLALPVIAVLDRSNGAGGVQLDDPQKPGLLTVKLAPPSSVDPPSVVLDFGKELAGRVEVSAPGRCIVTVATGESREEAIKSPWGGVHQLDCEPGIRQYSPYSAFRYARLRFLAVPGSAPLTAPITVRLDHKYYPVRYLGAFDCSDPVLTRIWYTGAYTAHLCMQEDIWDAPKRDRARWMGDLHVSGRVIDVAFADRFLMEQTMQRLRADAGSGHVNGIPGYSCAWICGLADFHRHIGDMDYLRLQHDPLVSILETLRGDLDERGLFANRHGAWSFVDWSPDFNADGPRARAATHFFLIDAVKEAAFLFDEMGDVTRAAACRQWAGELTQAAQSGLLQAGGKTFSDRRQDNAMAIYSGATTPEQTAAIYDAVLQPDASDWKTIASPYYNNYVIYAMSLAGHTPEALEVIRRIWGGMLDEGATSFWEAYDPSWEKSDFHAHLHADDGIGYFVSLCHGWSAGPTSFLTERVLGVRPTGAGCKTVEIAPELGDLKWAEGKIPTPRGILQVRVEKTAGGMSAAITLPPGVIANVILPGRVAIRGPVAVSGGADGSSAVTLTHPGRYLLQAKR